MIPAEPNINRICVVENPAGESDRVTRLKNFSKISVTPRYLGVVGVVGAGGASTVEVHGSCMVRGSCMVHSRKITKWSKV